ncbi:response regulator [Massilia dura]|uniref:Response regulator n=1 Tax=Pseudoduganella dura TaxID=321982 RepID=A0A6I3XDT5_9BURK|nr:response regulator [Pseudoduganella dura]MUI11731.1 response regulator [Pseudoduganella dura]GGX78673.1 hypothetical protein GCM10007386_07100 [Pseudoduganella dura]
MDPVPPQGSTAKTILIVDDDADIRSVLSEFLEEEGYATATAPNGREALSYLQKHPETSVVLLDLMMPVMNGFQFRASQKSTPAVAAVPVVVMTARGAFDPAEMDVQCVLAKPLDLDLLVASLDQVRRPAELR